MALGAFADDHYKRECPRDDPGAVLLHELESKPSPAPCRKSTTARLIDGAIARERDEILRRDSRVTVAVKDRMHAGLLLLSGVRRRIQAGAP